MNKTVKHAIILAGGKGTRLAEQTKSIPKPLVEVGNIPIIAHIINHLVSYGVEHIVIAGGYKVEMIKEYFTSDRYRHQGSITITEDGVEGNSPHIQRGLKSLVVADTGLTTGTAQRIKLAAKEFNDDSVPFWMTYGDSVSDVNLDKVVEQFYNSNSKLTLTGVQYQERFGILQVDPDDNNKITKFAEKSMSMDEFINGGFMVLDPEVLEYIYPEDNDFSKQTMPRLQAEGNISAYLHTGFWAAMDTQSDYENLNEIHDRSPELFTREVK